MSRKHVENLRRLRLPKPGPGAKATHGTAHVVFYDDGGQRVCDTGSEVEVWLMLDKKPTPEIDEDLWQEYRELIPEDQSELAQALRERFESPE